MISRDTIFGIGSLVGYFSLFLGVLGQALFMQPVTKPHLPAVVAVMISCLPWLVVFTITFTKQAFLPPRPFRFCLLFAICWFAVLTIVAEVLHHFGYMPPDSADIQSRVLMHIGWLSLLFIIPRYIAIRRYESEYLNMHSGERRVMSDTIQVVQEFENRVRAKLPELTAALRGGAPDSHGNYVVLDLPWPHNPSRCRLGAFYSPDDCFEVSFSVAEARGPAERQILVGSDLSGAVSATVDFLRDILAGRILVDLFRYRLLWFESYYLAFFREASHRPRRRVVETLRWRANGKVDDAG